MSKSPAQFAVRTMRALEVLAFDPTTAPRLAAELGVHTRTSRRLLDQLRRDGWVSSSFGAPYVYAPTLRFVALAAHIGARSPLATLTAPAVEQLHAATGMRATLTIPAYDATVCLVRGVGEQAGPAPLTLLAPAHCTAAGKVLMAHRDAWREAVLALPLVRCTERTSVDADWLGHEFARIRLDGYGTAEGEHVEGVQEVAAPVAGPGGEVLAAIGVGARDLAVPVSSAIVSAVREAGRDATAALAAGANEYPMHRGIVYRMLASYGLAPVDAYL